MIPRPTKVNGHPPIRRRHCPPCQCQWMSTETTCFLCGGDAVDGELRRHYKNETYSGVYQAGEWNEASA